MDRFTYVTCTGNNVSLTANHNYQDAAETLYIYSLLMGIGSQSHRKVLFSLEMTKGKGHDRGL